MSERTMTLVAALLREAERILFVTGAGMSADSGLPTYRGVGSLYDDVDTEEGVPIEVALSGPMLAQRPELTWKYLWQIGAACHGASFNRGHEVLAAIEQRKPETWILTQNVDGFHHAAGSRNVVEIHGCAFNLLCVSCDARFEAGTLIGDYGVPIELPPRCPDCGGLIRPDVVLFSEMLPERAVDLMYRAQSDRDVVVSIGTSAVFPYIVEPVLRARLAGVPTVEINPGRTEVSDEVDHRIESGAADALDRLFELMEKA